MSLILAVDEVGGMRYDLCDVLIVEAVDLLILSEGIIEHVHDDAGVVHHAEGVQSGGDAALVPPVEDHLDAAEAALHYTDQSRVLLQSLIDDLYVSLVGRSEQLRATVGLKLLQFET